MKKILHDIHLWLSVPFGIFITLICFSGSMLVFEKELTAWCRPELFQVTQVKEAPLPLDSLMQTVAATLPDSVTITGVTITPDAKATYLVSLSQPRRASIYVDPYTGEVKGRSERLPFFDTMFHLHRWLLGASQSADGGMSLGKLVVGCTTLALALILLTGILMWLTNRHKPLVKSLTISFNKGWLRFWHDLHVAGGIYATLFLLALALTGLTWSFSWYRTGFYRLFGVEQTAEGGRGAHGQTAERSARGERGGHSERGGRRDGQREGHREGWHRRSPYAHWQEVYDQLAQSNPGYRQITLSAGSAGVVPKGRNSLRTADIYSFNPRSGEITESKTYAESADRATKVRSGVYTVHTGSWGGLLTRLLTFLSALLGATLPLTGYYLWIRRLVVKGRHPRK